MKKIKICFVHLVGSPDFLGGGNLFHKNLIKYIYSKHKNISISWIYFGKENKRYIKEGVEYIQLKSGSFSSPLLIRRSLILSRFLEKNFFDVINTMWGISLLPYKKKKNQRIIQAFHGTEYYFNKNHFKRFNLIQKVLFSPLLAINWFVDRPLKKADKIICVSEKVKKEVKKLYGKKKNMVVIRTGVDLKNFRVRDKNKIKKKLGFDNKKIYGLYVGGGGYWTKGLDRTIKLSEEMYKINKKYRLIVIGSDLNKVKHLINKEFVIFLRNIPRKDIVYYYNIADFFFCLSRYDGGAPTMVVSESMASGCLVVCAKSAQQEIITDGKNGLIIGAFEEKEAKKVLANKGNKRIILNSKKTIKEISLNEWGEKYLKELLGY